MDPREQAYRVFQEVWVPAYRQQRAGDDWALSADTEEEEAAFEILKDAGLLRRRTLGYRPEFSLTPTGKRACIDAVDVRELLGLAVRHAVAPNIFMAPVAAVNTAAGGTATGTIQGDVNVSVKKVDAALHALIDLQDQLEGNTEEIWRILQRVRGLELRSELTAENLESLEIRAFLKDVRPDKQELVLKVLGMVPELLKFAGTMAG